MPSWSSVMSGPAFFRTSEQRTAACKKCGYSGHLTFQCRNFVQLDPEKDVVLDVSSTSSSDSDIDSVTPLTSLRQKELKDKLKKKKKVSHRSTYSSSM